MHMPRLGGELRLGLALGAGGARGLAHIPVLEALDELGIRPSVISGASIGAIMGAAYAAGISGAEIRGLVHETFRKRADVVARIWGLRPRTVKEFFGSGALSIGQFDAEKVLGGFLPSTIPEDFAGLATPLKIIATDFYGWQEEVVTKGNLRQAIAASIAIPVLFRPVNIDGRLMVDGGLFNPLPFDVIAPETNLVIAVDVIGGPTGSSAKMPTPTEAIFGTSQLLMRAITTEKLRQPHAPEIIVRPAINSFRLLDFMKYGAILKASEPVKDEIKRALEKALAA